MEKELGTVIIHNYIRIHYSWISECFSIDENDTMFKINFEKSRKWNLKLKNLEKEQWKLFKSYIIRISGKFFSYPGAKDLNCQILLHLPLLILIYLQIINNAFVSQLNIFAL